MLGLRSTRPVTSLAQEIDQDNIQKTQDLKICKMLVMFRKRSKNDSKKYVRDLRKTSGSLFFF